MHSYSYLPLTADENAVQLPHMTMDLMVQLYEIIILHLPFTWDSNSKYQCRQTQDGCHTHQWTKSRVVDQVLCHLSCWSQASSIIIAIHMLFCHQSEQPEAIQLQLITQNQGQNKMRMDKVVIVRWSTHAVIQIIN